MPVFPVIGTSFTRESPVISQWTRWGKGYEQNRYQTISDCVSRRRRRRPHAGNVRRRARHFPAAESGPKMGRHYRAQWNRAKPPAGMARALVESRTVTLFE